MEQTYNIISFKNVIKKYGRFINSFYEFYVDGIKLDYTDYNWRYAHAADLVDSFEGYVSEEIEEDLPNLVLFHCECGEWMCDSLLARVVETSDSIIWQLHYRCDDSDKIERQFVFEKTQYNLFVDELKKTVYLDYETLKSTKSMKKLTGKLSRKEKKKMKRNLTKLNIN